MNLWVLLIGQVALLLLSATGFVALGWLMLRALRKMRRALHRMDRFVTHAEHILFAVKEYNQLGHEAHKDAKRVLTKVEAAAEQAPTVEQVVQQVAAVVPPKTAEAVVEKINAAADSGVLKRDGQ